MDILVHTSDIKVDVLEPNRPRYTNEEPCIFMAMNCFIPYFGQYVYLFDYELLKKHFAIRRMATEGVRYNYSSLLLGNQHDYDYRSIPLEYEYRIYEPIDVNKYGLGVLTLLSVMKGTLETRLKDIIVKREFIDLEGKDEGK